MYGTILVATDGSDPARAAVDRAVDLAATYGATLRVLYVVDVGDVGLLTPDDAPVDSLRQSLRATAEEVTADAVDRATEAGVDATAEIRIGVPHVEVLDCASDCGADLVVLGTHGRTGLRRALIGSVAERVLRRSDVPVLTVHPGSADADG